MNQRNRREARSALVASETAESPGWTPRRLSTPPSPIRGERVPDLVAGADRAKGQWSVPGGCRPGCRPTRKEGCLLEGRTPTADWCPAMDATETAAEYESARDGG